jgi:hypothetical protein
MPARRIRLLQSFGVSLVVAVLGSVLGASAQFNLDWHTIDGGGQTFSTGGDFCLGGTVGQADTGESVGGIYALFGGFWFPDEGFSDVQEPRVEQAPLLLRVTAGVPNPFHDASYLRLELPEGVPVRVLVFDATGCLVRAVQDGWMPAGRHTLVWKGDRDSGQRAPVGIYMIQVRAGQHESRHQVLLLQ